MKEFNMADYNRLPAKTFESQTGTGEVWRSIIQNENKNKNILTIIFGDDVMIDMGWKGGDRLAMHQHKKDLKSFYLMEDTVGAKITKNVGNNTRTCRIMKTIDLPAAKLAPCLSWKKLEIAELDNKKILTVTL